MKWNWDVTVHTQSERLVAHTVSATTRQVAERKVRRKYRVRPYSVRARMAADQPLTPAQEQHQFEELLEKARQ